MIARSMTARSPDVSVGASTISVRRATIADVSKLLTLYEEAYGGLYPVPMGSSPDAMKAAILDREHCAVLAAYTAGDADPIGVLYFEIDPEYRLAYAGGLVIRKDQQKHHIGSAIVGAALDWLDHLPTPPNSVYGLTRTLSAAPQKICFRHGFRPFGLLPNFAKMEGRESVVLVVRHRQDYIEKTRDCLAIIKEIQPLFDLAYQQLNQEPSYRVIPESALKAPTFLPTDIAEWEWESDTSVVTKRYAEHIAQRDLARFPLRAPNVVISHGDIDFFVHVNYAAQNGSILAATSPVSDSAQLLNGVVMMMESRGLQYIDCWLPCEDSGLIRSLSKTGFLPLAVYPAMVEREGRLVDYLMMGRTLNASDLSGVKLEKSVQPYAEHYLSAWTEQWKAAQLAKLDFFSAA